MALFTRNSNGGIIDVIRCDEPSFLVWKWHPKNSVEGLGNKENAIRWGSSLRVKEGEVAVFVYKQNEEVSQDFFEGPTDCFLHTSNLPVLTSILGLVYDGQSPFQAEVYFINVAKILQSKFAVPFFDIYDPRFTDYSVPVAIRGTLTFKIKDYKEFIKLHRLSTFSLEQFLIEVKDFISNAVKSVVSNAPFDFSIPVIQIERKIGEINRTVSDMLKPRLENEFGVLATSIDISAIEVDKTSEGYRQLKQVTQDVTTSKIQAEAQANIKNIHDMQQVNVEHIRDSLRIEREEAQYAKHLQTQTDNFSIHQLNQQTSIGIAGAEALGKMGNNNATVMNGSGFNPAGMMTGIAMGNVLGQNMASMMGGALNGLNTMQPTPPPISTSSYFLAVDGKATGPFTIQELSKMIGSGKFSTVSFVWKQGMTEWAMAKSIPELLLLFNNNMPPIPQ